MELRSVKQNTVINLVGVALPLVVALFSIPRLLDLLGEEGFSILLMIWALIGYFSLFDFGVGRALTYELSQIRKEDKKNIGTYINAGLCIVGISSIVSFLLVFFLSEYAITKWYDVSAGGVEDITRAIKITAIAVVPTTITSGLRGALEGLNKFMHSNINRSILGVSIFFLPLVAIWLYGVSLTIIAFFLLFARIFVLILAFLQLREYLVMPSYAMIELMPTIFKYGGWVSVTGLVAPLMIYGDRFFLGAILSVDQLTYYATPQEGLLRLLVIPGAVASALFHDLSAHKFDLKKLKLDTAYYQKRIAIIMGLIFVGIVIFCYPFYIFWMGDEFAQRAYWPSVIMGIGIFFSSIAVVSLTTISAIGNVKYIALLFVSELVVFIPTFYFMTVNYGLIGASMTWSLRCLADFYFLDLYLKRTFRKSFV